MTLSSFKKRLAKVETARFVSFDKHIDSSNCASPSFHPFLHPFICPPFRLSTLHYVSLVVVHSVCLYVHLVVCLFVLHSVCLFVPPPVYRSSMYAQITLPSFFSPVHPSCHVSTLLSTHPSCHVSTLLSTHPSCFVFTILSCVV